MEGKLQHRKSWKKFVLFTIIISLIVGIFSVVSDHLSNFSENMTLLEFIFSYLAVMINSLPIWFIIAMLVGYLYAKDIKEAALLGAIYTITAITFYFVIQYFYEDITVTISLKDQVFIYLEWYGASAVGGILGGIAGFITKKIPYTLLGLLVGLVIQLFVNGTSSWSDIVGIAQNVTFCLMIVVIVCFLIAVNKKNRVKYEFSRKL